MERQITDEDLWGTDSGLVTNYEGTVVDAWFGVDAQYNSDITRLHLKMATDIDATPETTEGYNCGPDWQTIDGGETVVHPTRKKFVSSTQAGKVVDRMIELAGKEMRERGIPPTNRLAYIGSRWFMEEVTDSGKRRDTGEEWKSTRNYPSKFLGFQDGENAEVGGPAGTSTRSSVLDGIDPAALVQIASLAKTLPHGAWVDKVMEVDGVLQNDELIAALPDYSETGLYEILRSKNNE